MRRQLGRLDGLHLVQGGIGVGLHHAEEGVVDPLQHLARLLHRHDGVVEGGRVLVVGDGGDLGQLLLHARLKGRLVVAVLDDVEARRLVRQGAGGIERAASGVSARRSRRKSRARASSKADQIVWRMSVPAKVRRRILPGHAAATLDQPAVAADGGGGDLDILADALALVFAQDEHGLDGARIFARLGGGA